MAAMLIPRLVVISGASRGVGYGICRQVLAQDPQSHVVVLARNLQSAEAVATELGEKAHPVQCDVTDWESCESAAAAIRALGGSELLSLVNNAGYAADLPWFPTPWPAEAARETLDVNLYGAERLTRALLPQLLASSDGRVVFVSSGGGRMNMKRMSSDRRALLLGTSLTWGDIDALAEAFTTEYETAARAQTEEAPLPCLSPTGLWLQSYGFSKACLGAYCTLLAREHPALLSVTCSPGFVATDMASTYTGSTQLRSIDEGGEVPAWLSVDGRSDMKTAFYMPDRSIADWVAD
jgi:NAD(P)-dependent dehydrogenase (short-subunit alcohol dehydrogenase family)